MLKKLLLFLPLFVFSTNLYGQPTAERPEYHLKAYLTIVYHKEFSELDQKLYNLFRNNKAFINLKNSTNFNEWTDDYYIVKKTNWKKFLGTERPVILLQSHAKPDGTADVIFFARGQVIQNEKLIQTKLNVAIKDYTAHLRLPVSQRRRWQPKCPDGNCPWRQLVRPDPTPSNPPEPKIEVSPISPTIDISVGPPENKDDTADEDESEKPSRKIPLIVLGIPIIAGLAGLYHGVKSPSK